MIFLVKETLTEEDWNAWKKLARYREKSARKERWAAVRDWAGNKLLGVIGMVLGNWGLYVSVISGERFLKRIGYGIIALAFLITGGLTFLSAHYPDRLPCRLAGRESPVPILPDVPFRAVFFEDGSFSFWEPSGKTRLGYHTVTGIWEDEDRIFLVFGERPPLVLRKDCLVRGAPEEWKAHLVRCTGRTIERFPAAPRKSF